jgi:hypothetical protein
MGRACSMHGEGSNTYRALVVKSEGKRLVGGSTHRWRVILGWINRMGW